jgi:hypothetical protein
MTNVIKLNTRSKSPADLLEVLRQKIEAGEVEVLMFCIVDTAGCTSTRFSTASVHTLLGMAAVVDFDVKQSCLGGDS